MKVIFGLDLDGHEDLTARDRFNELICGPNGFLGLLELRLGLPSKPVSYAIRVAQYRVALETAATQKPRFYSESFGKDGFSSAETLLRWRDELILGGWDGSSDPVYTARLQDFADVEQLAGSNLSPGFGDRIRLVLSELERRDAKLSGLELLDDPKYFPRLLRDLFTKLGASFRIQRLSPAAALGTDLWAVQQVLVDPSPQSQIKLANDGTVSFVTAYSEVTLAHFAGQILQNSRQENLSVSIIVQSECPYLEAGLRAMDEPVFAVSTCSTARPILQTLALALALRWEPLDPRELLAFLIHPVSPVTDGLRYKLAGAVAERPGTGGPRWISSIEAHQKSLTEKFAADPSLLLKHLKQCDEDLAKWITVDRFDPLTGAPAAQLASTCAAIASWAIGTAGGKDLPAGQADQYLQLASHSSELAAILKSLPKVTRAQLDRLVEQLIGRGSFYDHSVAEAKHAHKLRTPGALLESVDTVLWWDFRGTGFFPRSPWTETERRQMERNGVELPSAATYYAHQNLTATKAILATKQKIVFFCPRVIQNEPVAHHPLRDRIRALIDGQLPLFDLDASLADPMKIPSGALPGPVTDEFSHRPLAVIRRWWKLADPRYLGPKDFESFSSASKFVFSPYQWVLGYKAQLQPGLLFRNQIAYGSRQLGNLLHRLIELALAPDSSLEWPLVSRQDFHSWLDAAWQKLLPADGANLLLPGNHSQAESLMDEAKRGIWSLIEHLRAGSVTKTEINVSADPVPFVGGKLIGYIDLLVQTHAGRKAIIDLKYSGHKRKRAELENNLQLQLAVYGYLTASGGAWPESAFFILKTRALLKQDNRFFPNGEIVKSNPSDSGLEACWNEFKTVWSWRRDLLDKGWIECTIAGAAPGSAAEPSSIPPIPRWLSKTDEDRFNDFDVLTGWRKEA